LATFEFTVTTRLARFEISAWVRLIGTDLLVAISGGEMPHIGAVAVAQPRPSLRNPNVTSATASVICCMGHKEDALAKTASEKLSATFNCRVVVTAGIHWDNLTDEDIRQVQQSGEVLIELIRQRCAESFFTQDLN
jgi:gallate decarboxylase subunit D